MVNVHHTHAIDACTLLVWEEDDKQELLDGEVIELVQEVQTLVQEEFLLEG